VSHTGGHGPPPKDPNKRARRNKDPIGTTVLTLVPGEQPFLPADYDWSMQTVEWWRLWREAELSNTFTALDWMFLLDTAVLHDRFWKGDMKAAPELRLRVAKFGMTPEDRARLRIVFADADEKDQRRGQAGSSSKPPAEGGYSGLRAVRDQP
jgi:hypothetical protein